MVSNGLFSLCAMSTDDSNLVAAMQLYCRNLIRPGRNKNIHELLSPIKEKWNTKNMNDVRNSHASNTRSKSRCLWT